MIVCWLSTSAQVVVFKYNRNQERICLAKNENTRLSYRDLYWNKYFIFFCTYTKGHHSVDHVCWKLVKDSLRWKNKFNEMFDRWWIILSKLFFAFICSVVDDFFPCLLLHSLPRLIIFSIHPPFRMNVQFYRVHLQISLDFYWKVSLFENGFNNIFTISTIVWQKTNAYFNGWSWRSWFVLISSVWN